MNRIRNTRRDFLKAMGLGAASLVAPEFLSAAAPSRKRPNIVLILADDMGFSDLGCYGGEIETPNLDGLAAEGLRFSQFYNCAKCAPTRTSILTGLYHQQTDIGRSRNCVTVAEVLRSAGYTTLASGKWHVGSTPMDRGFDHYFGMLGGSCSYFVPDKTFRLGRGAFMTDDKDFYTTNAFTDYALQFLDEVGRRDKPFFLYLAYNAPHYPLHALPEDIAKYRGKYMKGWDVIRRQRYARLIELGLIDKKWPLSTRGADRHKSFSDILPWEQVEDKRAEDLDMAVYAAMVDRMDQNIGRILKKLGDLNVEDDTLVMFLSDNGGCPYERNRTKDIAPGPAESYRTYDSSWANVSNTPFRLYKRFNHEGGNATPFIARWPAVIKKRGGITHQVGHIIDLMATCLDAAGARYPSRYDGHEIAAMEGKSLMPIFEDRTREGHDALFWEFMRNKAVRKGKWKLVTVGDNPWELYDMEADRTELNDLSANMPEKVEELAGLYEAWVRRCKSARSITGRR
ncbi:MAG: arylsulfatase [Phycisphaerales bacterium]|nr:MAG: arylsulfatase [Phycisphaerales bacterium]